MSSGYIEPAGGTSSPSTGTAVGSKPIRALLKVLRNVDIVAEPDFGSTFIPKIKTPFEILSTSLRLQNPAQTFYTNIESAALVANQSIKVPIITATESGNKKDELVFLKQAQSLENKTFPTYYDVTETAAPANPAAGTLRIYANSTTHELTQRNSAGTEVKLSDGSGGGGGGAPTDAQYLTLGVNVGLTNERVLTGSGRISITDAGPGVTATLDIPSGSIVDSYIGTHTSTKISITAKGQLNSSIVYTDQTNSFGDFDQVFKDNRLRINNPADTFSYTIIGAAIAANRNLTLPLLTGNDIAVTEAFAQTLTNKTISASSNTISNIGDAEHASHTSTKISITAKGQLNSSIAYIDQANVFSDNDQSFRSARLRVANPANTFFYNFTAAAIAANRTINLPLLTATDTMAVLDFAQTFTNKTISGSSNTITNIGDSAISAHTSTKVTITAKGQLNSNILYGDQNNNFGGFYHDITEIAAPANPGAGVLRIYANSTTHELTQRDSSGTEKKFSDGSGGSGAPTNSTYLVLSSDGTLSAERVATASSRVTITDAGANSTATFDIGSGSVVDAYIGSHTSTKVTITAKGQLNSAIVYNDQANSFGDFAQTFKDNQLKINNPADTFAYTIVGAAIGANRNLTLPLLTGNDTAVTEAFAQTLTNKTIAAGSNTVSGIVDANIDAHTSTKVTITAKGQLNSSIAYVDQANVFSDNDQSFRSNRLRIANPANTFFYSFTGAAIAASRVITLPLLTGGDTMVTEAFGQTLTNKTLAAGSNTITGLVDANLNAHTSTKVTITTKGQLNSSIVYTDQANTFGAFDQLFPTSRLKLGDSDASHAYIFAGSNLAADRTVTWPLLTGNDVPVLEAFSQTLTNKTINASNNTVTNIGDAAITAHTSTKVTITAKGQLNSQILYGDANKSFGAFYFDVAEIAAPASPSAGTLRIWADSTTHELSQKNSSGTVVKMSDGSGGGGITASSTDTLTNKTIGRTSNVLSYISPYAFSIYRDGGAVKVVTNATGAVASHATLGPAIDAVLANTSDPTAEVHIGFYDLASGFTGWNVIKLTNIWIHENAYINVPEGYTGDVWKLSPTDTVVYKVKVDGGRYDEQGTSPTYLWDLIAAEPISTNPPTTTGAVYECEFKNMWTWRCNRPIYLHTTNKSWINQNRFINMYNEGCVILGAEFEHTGTWTAGQSGINGNYFECVDGQATAVDLTNHWPATTYGYKNVIGEFNTFVHCVPWDLTTSGSAVSTMTIGANATGTKIIGGIVDSVNFTDNGVRTSVNGWGGIVHNDAATFNGTFTLKEALTVTKNAESSAAERLFSMGVAGATGDLFTLDNLVTTDNRFNPIFRAIAGSAAQTANSNVLYFQGIITDANNTSSTEPVVVFGAKTDTNAVIADKPMVGIANQFSYTALFYPDRLDMTTKNLVNAGINASNNTVTNIGDSAIAAHTSTKITITAKGQLNSSIVYTDQANTFGAFNQTFPTSRLLLGDSDASHAYIFAGSNLTANRTVTWPLLTGDDTAVTEAFAQNLTNKTLMGMKWRAVAAKTTDVTAADDELIVPVDASSANRTLTLPAASGRTGKVYVVQKSDSSTNTVTVDPNSTETVNGASTFVLTQQYQAVTLWSDGSNWFTQPNSTERTGKATANGNGSQTAFTISHGLGSTPSNCFVDCSSHAIARTWTVDSTTITVTFSSAPSSGTNNVIIYWRAVV